MTKKFVERKGLDLPAVTNEVLKEWDDKDIFHKSITEREGCPSFIFFEGPPSANGHPGIHHVLARSIKDLFCRYRTMKGYQVKRKAGWDTHGLPVELGVEKLLGITKEDIGKTISVEKYNDTCRKDVMKFTAEWTELSHKMGYWVDLEHPYITYENSYIETLWWLLKQLYNKHLLYKGYTIQPYSPAAGTGLSSHELNQPGCYRDVKDTTVTAQFKILDPKPEMTEWGTPYFLAWTTTPWTLPSNTALCVGPKIKYVLVQTYNMYTGEKESVVLAEDLLHSYFNPKGIEVPMEDYKHGDKIIPYRIVASYMGPELEGMRYEQLMPYVNPGEGAFRVILGDYVTTEDGTGIVHIAPTFGADDARVAKAAGIPPLQLVDKKGEHRPMVDLQGKFYLLTDLDPEYIKKYVNVEAYKTYEGRFVKNDYDPNLSAKDETLDISICMDLKIHNKAFKIEKHVHNYPHCWRTDKPILYYPLDSWFIKDTACKDRMVALNKTINWKPSSTGSGRFGKWLENLNDWNLSRSRFWGTPLPIWRSEDREEICIGSIEELYNEIEKSVSAGFMKSNPLKDKGFVPGDYSKDNYDKIDLHRPYIDYIILCSPTGKPMKRESDLIDVWFDSGSMPYAQLHYPFENKELFESGKVFPADFIAEGVDQTRGWFFTLHAIATMIFDQVAYKAVVSNGLVLDAKGNKMSKRLGNAVNPFTELDKFGSDAVRWYMITNSSPWDNLKFDENGVGDVSRKFFGTLSNTYSFFTMYANVDGFDYSQPDVTVEKRQEIDRWILSELNTLIKDVDSDYNDYEPTRAGRRIQTFVNDNLSNWYVRLNRKRFWGNAMSEDKLSAYQTLYTCLETVAKLMAPIAPFYADRLFMDLIAVTGKENVESVHLAKYPECNENLIDKELEARMELAQSVTSMVLALRRKVNIKVRQPLQCVMIPVMDDKQKVRIEAVAELIRNEVNVKELKFVGEENGVLEKKVKCNFRVMGKKYGKLMKSIATAVSKLSQSQISTLEHEGKLPMIVDGQSIEIESSDVEIYSEDIPGWLVANEGTLTIALEVTLTDDLRKEGLARELVNRLQNLRKDSGLEITDRIIITLEEDSRLIAAVNDYHDYISGQVLANAIRFSNNIMGNTELDLDEFKVRVNIEKA